MKFLAVKNWWKFQQDNNGDLMEGPMAWIKDYTAKESDYDYKKLSPFTRYLYDGIRRLTGKMGHWVENDPSYIRDELDLRTTPKVHITQSIASLVGPGLLTLVDTKEYGYPTSKSRVDKQSTSKGKPSISTPEVKQPEPTKPQPTKVNEEPKPKVTENKTHKKLPSSPNLESEAEKLTFFLYQLLGKPKKMEDKQPEWVDQAEEFLATHHADYVTKVWNHCLETGPVKDVEFWSGCTFNMENAISNFDAMSDTYEKWSRIQAKKTKNLGTGNPAHAGSGFLTKEEEL
jgi:hypothetical protein